MPELKWRAFFCGGPQHLPLTFVCFVSAEQGKVLKVLHTSEGVFIISQYSLFHNEGPVLNMAVDSQKVSQVLAFSVNLRASHWCSKLLKTNRCSPLLPVMVGIKDSPFLITQLLYLHSCHFLSSNALL